MNESDYSLRRQKNDLPRGGLPILMGVLTEDLDAATDDGFTETTAALRVYTTGRALYCLRLGGATGGTYTATLNSQTTGNIAYDASAATVKSALEALSISGATYRVYGDALPGGPLFIAVLGVAVTGFTVDDGNLTGSPDASIVSDWGWAPSEKTITVSNRSTAFSASADETLMAVLINGKWRPVNVAGCRQNEIQQITVFGFPLGGTFDLIFNSGTAIEVDFDATASELETLLEGHADIGSGNVSCSGGPFPNATVEVEWIGDLENTNVPIMRADWVDLTGGTGMAVLISVDQQGAPYAL